MAKTADYDLLTELDRLAKSGELIGPKARMLVDAIGIETLAIRLRDPDTPTTQIVDILKLLMELGDLKPKNNAPQTQQERFSVKIVTGSQEQVITVTAGESADTPEPINVTPTVVIPMPDPTPPQPEIRELPPPPDVSNDPFLAEVLGCEVTRG